MINGLQALGAISIIWGALWLSWDKYSDAPPPLLLGGGALLFLGWCLGA